MKLLKGRTKELRVIRPISENKDKYTLSETKEIKPVLFLTKNKYKGKKLIYNQFSKQIISENPGILKAFNFLLKNPKENLFVSKKNSFEIFRITKTIKNNERSFTPYFTKDAFILTINSEVKKRFFIKYSKNKFGAKYSATQELISLRLIEGYASQVGFKIIKPHFAFDNFNNKGGFIVYDFSYLHTVSDAYKMAKISNSELIEIKNRISSLNNLLDRKLDLNNIDINIKNIFIDFTKKPYSLYLFDTYAFNQNIKQMFDFSKKSLS